MIGGFRFGRHRQCHQGDYSMIIDIHAHPYEESVVELPVRTRGDVPTRVTGPEDDLWEGWLETMLRLGVTRTVLFGCFGNNDWTARIVARHTPHLIGFAHVFPLEGESACDELTRAVEELGLQGVKLYGWHDGCAFGSPETQAVVSRAHALGVPVVFDCVDGPYDRPLGDEWRIKQWGDQEYFRGLTHQVRNPRPMLTAEYLGGMEEATLVLAHLGGGLGLREPERILTYPNVYVDTAQWVNEDFAGSEEEEDWLREIEQTVQAVGAARVLFGSDDRQEDALPAMGRLRINDNDRAAVMGGNAARLLGMEGD
jgi:predicted TIM-barrel fold metal-dependent hydrolase